jgi:hypothetical protein
MELLPFITEPVIKFGNWIGSNTILGIRIDALLFTTSTVLILYSLFRIVYWLGQQSML